MLSDQCLPAISSVCPSPNQKCSLYDCLCRASLLSLSVSKCFIFSSCASRKPNPRLDESPPPGGSTCDGKTMPRALYRLSECRALTRPPGENVGHSQKGRGGRHLRTEQERKVKKRGGEGARDMHSGSCSLSAKLSSWCQSKSSRTALFRHPVLACWG